jgi:pimeloyl-ACP methyl ester carboxylesterase
MAYERAGDGPPLVLLHGYVGDGPTTWRPQLEGLGDEFTVIAWDAPGAGRSSDPPESFGMTGYADCLAGFVECLGLERPDAAGCRTVARSPWPSSAATPPCRRP